MQKDRYKLTQDILKKVAEIDEFKGAWMKLKLLHSHILPQLEWVALLQSSASSTRIEGSEMSDKDVEDFLQGLNIQKFRDCDKQEVQGYKELLETVCANYETTPFTENTIKGFHKILLQYSQKDERHLGEYKKHPNTVVAFDANGKQLGIIFKTTEPYLTPKEIQELLERTGAWIRGEDKHRLLIIAEFIVDFLSIHPFQDGNGRLSRILTNFLLLQHGYEFVRFSSLESVIESNKRLYYLALRRSQKDRGKKNETIEPWINFFLDVLVTMTRTLKLKVEDKGISIQISEREQKVLEYVNKHQRVTSTDVMNKYSIGQRAASKILLQMVEKKLLIRQGKGKRDAFYTLNII
ncbi:MAG: hypothetical protein A3H61_04820 [Candidatus Jacksonbacteria bacterium RIFCSPLOWO2_02_FULL_44_20]|uniref:Fido domain-containing protein n=1 Tax=Candidatus Jacksonbacteria bacterium RIFCSPLOWO2_02_FULL_44_20 TaxID=1798460 RepID=A0A1G2A9V4_9BACT|nr:MAG: hypothetical protein A3C00_02280 [Candidatus Jacksonbacteria bacterium RIFCSPHIGHO2_02_FULL_44_25]OGY72006.1 MAG: hypothetical protein A3E05_01830 [Candidatus Jacksonbacteria bacterium RIFCSPHIGHO2_12_FULL_44_12]OGY73445.1 MAG: hypothetical protein A3H61_04820 [Candidatus Jacksonbacteria bacterium RIFCSPLOWO2_02_FULL_44_20]OGY73610.1 MAG: hypothetical protein A3H07_00400 [Candidatus Jacksonbacteria bacterium RIFCSPLOWO2_12_FULL_44_15b]